MAVCAERCFVPPEKSLQPLPAGAKEVEQCCQIGLFSIELCGSKLVWMGGQNLGFQFKKLACCTNCVLILSIWACLSVLGLVSAVDIENVACFSMIPRVFIYWLSFANIWHHLGRFFFCHICSFSFAVFAVYALFWSVCLLYCSPVWEID